MVGRCVTAFYIEISRRLDVGFVRIAGSSSARGLIVHDKGSIFFIGFCPLKAGPTPRFMRGSRAAGASAARYTEAPDAPLSLLPPAFLLGARFARD